MNTPAHTMKMVRDQATPDISQGVDVTFSTQTRTAAILTVHPADWERMGSPDVITVRVYPHDTSTDPTTSPTAGVGSRIVDRLMGAT